MESEKKMLTRERILAAGAKLMRKRGIKAASVSDVMEEAGLTVGGFYAHFRSKERLVEETFRRLVREATASALAMLPPGLGGADKLRAFCKGYLSAGHRDSDKAGRGCPLAALSAEMGKGPPALQRMYASELETFAADNAAAFSHMRFRIDAGDFLGIMSTCVGGLTLARAARGGAMSERVLDSCYRQLDAAITELERKERKGRGEK